MWNLSLFIFFNIKIDCSNTVYISLISYHLFFFVFCNDLKCKSPPNFSYNRREKNRLQQLQWEQRVMEEKNKKRKALLTKTIAEK